MVFFKSLRFRLLVLVSLAIIPALGITYIAGMEQRRLARDQAVQDAYRLTRLAANYQSSLIEQTRGLLQYMAKETEIRDPARCESYFKRMHASFPMYASLNIASPQGQVFCSSAGESAISVADRSYFQKALRSREITIGEITSGRITGKTILPLAMPVLDGSDQVAGVLIAAVDLNQILGYTTAMQLPAQSAILIVDGSGTVLARYPEAESWAGQQMPGALIIQNILQRHGEGSAEAPGLDGVQRLYAFTSMRSAPGQLLAVSVGIPSSQAYAAANRLMWTNLAWMIVASLLALLVAWFGGEALFLRVVSLTAERDRAEQSLKEVNTQLEARVMERTEELEQANVRLNDELMERKKMVDILHRREAELRVLLQRLEQSNRDLQDFAYIASHDLQEPLRKIQAFSERLEQHHAAELSGEGQSYLARVKLSAARMQAMIQALLSYSRINSLGQDFAPTDLGEVVRHVTGDLEIRLHETGGQVLAGPLPTIQADPSQMHQLFLNLIGNSLKFVRSGVPPVVHLNAALHNGGKDGLVDIMVQDNGIGFEEKYLEKIFQPFQRLYSRDMFEGNGIGLPLCRKIVQRHHGSITATSIPDQGSCFVVTLPVTQPNEEGIDP